MGHVVIADAISFRDPDDGATRREEFHHLYAARGDDLPDSISDSEVKRLLDLRAIAPEGSQESQRAKAGMPRSAFGRPAGAMPMALSEAEQIKAVQSAAQHPGGVAQGASASDLARLPIESLAVMAKAFGVPVDDSSTKQSLALALADLGMRSPGATPISETVEAARARDEAHGNARADASVAPPDVAGEAVAAAGKKTGRAPSRAPAAKTAESDKKSGAPGVDKPPADNVAAVETQSGT